MGNGELDGNTGGTLADNREASGTVLRLALEVAGPGATLGRGR